MCAAFIHRINQHDGDRSLIDSALDQDFISIGWSEAEGLLETFDWEQFREIIRIRYYAEDDNLRRAGAAAGNLWRFIRDMAPDDYVVVPDPHGYYFYVARIECDAYYDSKSAESDSAYRRKVRWLSNGHAIPRNHASARLQQRMKTYSTSAYAADLVDDIKKCLEHTESGDELGFAEKLGRELVKDTLSKLREGEINDYQFEGLVANILTGLGAINSKIIPRIEDKGIDLTAEFAVGGTIQVVLGVQCKHWRQNPPVGVNVVKKLTDAIETHEFKLTHGLVVTTGTFSDESMRFAEDYTVRNSVSIQLIDGEELASLIVENGIKVLV